MEKAFKVGCCKKPYHDFAHKERTHKCLKQQLTKEKASIPRAAENSSVESDQWVATFKQAK